MAIPVWTALPTYYDKLRLHDGHFKLTTGLIQGSEEKSANGSGEF
jgi:hypothetical protein